MKIFSTKRDLYIVYPTFLKNVIILFLVLFIPTVIMIKISINITADNLLVYLMDKETELLKSQKKDIESKLSIIDNVANQILFDNDVWSYLYSDTTEPNYFIIKNIMQKLENITYSNKMIESIYFFDKKHNYVISDSLTTKNTFIDQLVLNDTFLKGTALKKSRILDRSTTFTQYVPVNITAYVKKLDNIFSGNEAILIINLKTDLFYDSLTTDENDSTVYITDLYYNSIYCSKSELDEINKNIIQQINSLQDGAKILHIGKDSIFVSTITSTQYNLRFIKVQNYNVILDSVTKITKKLITFFSLVLIFSTILILLSAFYLYYPLSTILHKIRCYNSGTIIPEKNEYALIDKTIEDLYNQNIDLNQKFEIAHGYLQTFSVHEFLINPKFDRSEFDKLLKVMGVTFPYPFFMIALINFDERLFKNTTNLRNIISPLFMPSNGIQCLVSFTGRDSIAIVINTCNGREVIFDFLTEILKSFKEQGVDATIGLGESFNDISLLPMYYNNTLAKMKQRVFSGCFEIIDLSFDYHNDIVNYPNELQEKLIDAIKSQDREKAFDMLEALFTEHFNNASNSVDYVKYVSYQIASSIYKSVLVLGATYNDGKINEYQLFCLIKNANHIIDVKLALHNFVDESIKMLEELSQCRYSELIQQAVEFIEQNYTRDISLDDIARNVHLSPNYLSNVFRRERGDTIFNFITALRMKRAAELLATTDMPVKEIANNVGYNNVQSFIRFFKKHFAFTPNQFRKNMQSGKISKITWNL